MTIPWQRAETAQILDMAIFINETILQTRGITQLLSKTHLFTTISSTTSIISMVTKYNSCNNNSSGKEKIAKG